MILLVTFVLLTSLCQWANTELFTAIVELEPLLETRKRIIDDLDHYIEKEETRLKALKKHLNQFKKEHEKAMKDIPNYLGNPINAFTLIKRLTELGQIEKTVKKGTDYIKNITLYHPNLKYPTLQDLTGAVEALTRLQNTYRLKVHELSEGMINGVKYSTPMTADDCYEVGKSLYKLYNFKSSLLWMTEALRKYKAQDEETYSFTEVHILEYLQLANYILGNLKSALEWTHRVLALDPNHARAQSNVLQFTKTIKENEKKLNKERRGDVGDPKQFVKVSTKLPLLNDEQCMQSYENVIKNYGALCRGEMEISNEISKRLKCWYSSENHPFLKYAPIKTEQMYIKPDIFMFHEVLSDDEIEIVKSIALTRLQRAAVNDEDVYKNKTNMKYKTDSYRIGKLAWIKDEESPEVARISQRVSDMTGLSMISAEALQVVNYGIGGHYAPHIDFAKRTQKEFHHRLSALGGNRMATVLFYMSDVAQGGATVFTELGLSLFPVKGAAAFWLNLHPSGEGDMATMHAACPVLRGSKWVSNKWIHLGGQEFLKPCDLEYQDEGIARKLPRPIPKISK